MTTEEIKLQAALTSLQGILKSKGGIIGEVVPATAVAESLFNKEFSE